MTRNRWMEDPRALEEADRLFRFVGEYVISFQWLEGKIDEIVLLSRGTENWSESQYWMAGKSNAEKIEVLKSLALSEEVVAKITLHDWSTRVYNLVERLHDERRRRNSILHAQFMFDFLAIGAPVVRTHIKRQGAEPLFDQEELSSERCDDIMGEIGRLAFDLGLLIVSLRSVEFNHTPQAPTE